MILRSAIAALSIARTTSAGVLLGQAAAQAPAQPQPTSDIVMKDVLLLPNVATSGRSWLREDHFEGAMGHVGTMEYTPSPGDSVTNTKDTEVQWLERPPAEPDGWVTSDALRSRPFLERRIAGRAS